MVKFKSSSYLNHTDNQISLPHDDHNHSNIEHDIVIDTVKDKLSRTARSRALFLCMILTFGFALVEAIGGYLINSIALQADAVHMLTDSAGLLIALIANKISQRPATINFSFGYGKFEALGALINCIFTLVLTLGLIIQVISRFFYAIEVHGLSLFILAFIGLIVNLFVVLILSKSSNSLNIKAALINALGDVLGSFVAIIAGAVIYFTNFSLIDPILSLIVVIILIVSNYRLIIKSSRVLIAAVPEYIDYEDVGRTLECIDGVVNVHDLHIWYMTANTVALSAHLVVKDPNIWKNTLFMCQKILHDKYNISHITLQHEYA